MNDACFPVALLTAGALAAGAANAQQFHIVRQSDAREGKVPDCLSKGARFALISGDPVKPGPFAFRLRMPPG